jgi:hypothetical protein
LAADKDLDPLKFLVHSQGICTVNTNEGMIYRTTKNKNTSKYIYGVTVTENNLTYENGSDLPLNMSINYAGLPIFKLG